MNRLQNIKKLYIYMRSHACKVSTLPLSFTRDSTNRFLNSNFSTDSRTSEIVEHGKWCSININIRNDVKRQITSTSPRLVAPWATASVGRAVYMKWHMDLQFRNILACSLFLLPNWSIYRSLPLSDVLFLDNCNGIPAVSSPQKYVWWIKKEKASDWLVINEKHLRKCWHSLKWQSVALWVSSLSRVLGKIAECMGVLRP